MKSRIPEYENIKAQEKENELKESQNIIDEFESNISRDAAEAGVSIDEYKAMLCAALLKNSTKFDYKPDTIRKMRKAIYNEKNGKALLKSLLEGKKRYEAKVQAEMEPEQETLAKQTQKALFLSRAELPLDTFIETSHSINGHKEVSKLNSLDDYERINNIRTVLNSIRNNRKCSEEKAIQIALEQNLLPDEKEILNLRLEKISKLKSSVDNSDRER